MSDRVMTSLDDVLSRLGVTPSPQVFRHVLADQVESLLNALPADGDDMADVILRARLEGYVAGLRGDEIPERPTVEQAS